jgi:hypothetical protein
MKDRLIDTLMLIEVLICLPFFLLGALAYLLRAGFLEGYHRMGVIDQWITNQAKELS